MTQPADWVKALTPQQIAQLLASAGKSVPAEGSGLPPQVSGQGAVPAIAKVLAAAGPEAQAAGKAIGTQADPNSAIADVARMSPFEQGKALKEGVSLPYRWGGMVGQVAKDALSGPGDFIAGVTGGEPHVGPNFASMSAMGLPPGPDPIANNGATPAPATDPNHQPDILARLLEMITGAYGADQSASVAAALTRDGGGPGKPYEPAKPSDREIAAQDNLDKMIAVLAKQSALPEPTFKERLGHVLVGLAVGYNNAYYGASGKKSIGAGIAGGLAGGAVAGQAYNDQISRDRTRVEAQNRRATQAAATLETAVVGQEGANRHVGERNALIHEQIQEAHRARIDANIRAAQRARNPLDRIKFAAAALKLQKDIHALETATPYDEVQVSLPGGQTAKVKDLGALREPAIAAIEAPTKDPILFKQAQDSVLTEFQKNGTMEQAAQYKYDVEKMVKDAVTQKLMIWYQQHPESLTRRAVQGGNAP